MTTLQKYEKKIEFLIVNHEKLGIDEYETMASILERKPRPIDWNNDEDIAKLHANRARIHRILLREGLVSKANASTSRIDDLVKIAKERLYGSNGN